MLRDASGGSPSLISATAAGSTAAGALHWPECLIEAACIGLFMISCCLFGTLFEHPASPIRQAITDPMLRRIPMGLAMGLTAIALIYSPLGQRSGAHMNPAATLMFFRLGKVSRPDLIGYVAAQIVGGIIGVQVVAALLGDRVADPSVQYVATLPGLSGPIIAWVAEFALSCLLMVVVLNVSNRPGIARYTGLCIGALVMIYIVVEAPLSGMSLNPARTLGSAVAAHAWGDLWIYFTAPPLGMLLAAELYLRTPGRAAVLCAKLHHPRSGSCHFVCHLAPAA